MPMSQMSHIIPGRRILLNYVAFSLTNATFTLILPPYQTSIAF